MLDIALAGGLVVDGTGRPGFQADVGVREGRVVAVGDLHGEPARRTEDIGGLVVAPGFIDVHTHYDAQVFWDGTLSPSPLHGVTTVIGGNCGFSIAPLDPADADYLLHMLARVEGMPVATLEAGVPWDWRSTGQYLAQLEGRLVPNAGFLVGHSALRLAVLHRDAGVREATDEEVDAMARLLAEGLEAGALGFSSSWSLTHNDHQGEPVPSRAASPDELLRLCAEVSVHPGTVLEFIPGVPPHDDATFTLMGNMSAVADRPLNWNVLQVFSRNAELVDSQLAGSDRAAQAGGYVVALTLPDTLRNRLNFETGFLLDILPGWDRDMALDKGSKLRLLATRKARADMDARAQSVTGNRRPLANWARYIVRETDVPDAGNLVGRFVEDIAAERGASAWDTLCDLVVADELRTVIEYEDRGQDDESWRRRVGVWRDPRAVIGASDAGAHVDMIDSFGYTTTVLARAVRERGLLPVEEAVHYLTGRPAALYGLTDRGVLRPGAVADLVVLDPDTVGPQPVLTRRDLPGGAARLYGGATGVERVFVGGEEVVTDGSFTGARPGRVLRSGRDTATVRAGDRP